MKILTTINYSILLLIYAFPVCSESLFDGIDDERPVSLEGIIEHADGNRTDFALLTKDGKPWTCWLIGKLNGPEVDLHCKDVKQIIFDDKNAAYDNFYPGKVTVISKDDKKFVLDDAYFFGSESYGKIRYVTINPITGKGSIALENVKNNIRSITTTRYYYAYKCNATTGKHYPESYIYDPVTSEKLIKCKPNE